MYNTDQMNEVFMTATLLPAVDYKDAFFQDLRDHIEPLVRNSLFQYLAYQYKGEEADKYNADPKADVPYLKAEADLRGIAVKDLVALVERNGLALKSAIKDLELLRIEFNLRYAKTKELLERVQLRDEFIPRIKTITESLG